jgi:hypothetical protein
MTEASTIRPVRFCYECGSRIGVKLDACWYCATPVRRELHPEKRCPFCAEPIKRDAIKCRHCGEFVDGRPRAEEQKPVNQIVVIDKEMLNALSDMRLLPGSPVPAEAREILDVETVRAIEDNRPEAIAQRGVRLLPGPAAPPAVIDVTDGASVDATGRELVETKGRDRVEAKYAVPPPPKAPPKPKPPKTAKSSVDVETKDIFRHCKNCSTEILASDNFCYYCGTQYRRTEVDKRRAAAARLRKLKLAVKVVLLFVLLAVLGLVLFYLYLKGFLPHQLLGMGE